MKFIIKFLLSLICAGFLYLIANASSSIPTYSDPKTDIIIQPKTSEFEIIQPANPTTGYRWTLISYDKHLLELIRSNYENKKPQLIGSGGKMSWIFKAKT